MRVLLEDSDGDVSKFIGIALGVAGGVIVLTGLLWFLYRRYGDLGGSLAGIPPERKILVFTDLGKLPDSAQRSHMRLNSARPPSRGVLPAAAALAAAVAAAPPPTPGSAASPRAVGGGASRPASGGRAGGGAASGSLLPALSVGLEAEPLPSTPGSIASPRGHGRALFNTMDHPRSSNTGGPGLAAADDSRPGSASTQPRGGSRGGTADGGLAAAGGGGGERPGSGGTGPRPSSSGSTAQARGRSCLAAAAAAAAPGTALPPALVPTGSVTTAWKVPPAPSELWPERSLNSLAAETTTSPVEAFDTAAPPGGAAAAAAAGPRVVSISGYGAVAAIAAGAGRPPLPYRSSASGSMPAAVAAAAAGSLGTAAAAAAAASGGGVASPIRSRISRSRPGSGGDGPRSGGGADGGGGGGATGSPLPGPSWQRPNGMRTSRPSQGAGRLSGTGIPDDTISTISGASSQFHSFSHAGEDAGVPQHPPQSHSQQHQQQQQQQQQQLEPQPAGGSGAASVLPGAASLLQRSRLAAATIPAIDQNSSAGGSQAPASEALAAAPTPAASVALTVAAESTPPTLPPARSGTAAASAREISEVVDSVGSRAVSSPGAAGPGSGNGALEVQSASIGSGGGGETSSQLISPTQAAWAAAVSLSSKLFGRGSRAGTPATQAQ